MTVVLPPMNSTTRMMQYAIVPTKSKMRMLSCVFLFVTTILPTYVSARSFPSSIAKPPTTPHTSSTANKCPPVPSGLVIACLDVKLLNEKSTDGKKTCMFSKKKSPEGKNVYLLNNVKFHERFEPTETNYYTADVLELNDAKKILQEERDKRNGAKPLFCVHGFNVPTDNMFEEIDKAEKLFSTLGESKDRYFPIPVLWSTEGHPLYYHDDKELAHKAAVGLKKLFINLKEIGSDVPKSLLCHSMGNRVLCYAADGEFDPGDTDDHITYNADKLAAAYAGVNFENIFMVAADIDGDIFNKDPKEQKDRPLIKRLYQKRRDPLLGKEKMAENIYKMLKNKKGGDEKVGKIHVLHNKHDRALKASYLANMMTTRLGKHGYMKKLRFFGIFQDKQEPNEKYHVAIENKNCQYEKDEDSHNPKETPRRIYQDKLSSIPEKLHSSLQHSYHFKKSAIAYYNNKCLED